MARAPSALAAIIGTAILLVGPSIALADKRTDTLRFAVEQAPESIDAYFNNQQTGAFVGHLVWDHLIERDPRTNEYKPSLATSWRWIDDTTLAFELRQGVRFHNGEPFNANDVVTTLNYVSDPANRSVSQANVNWIARAEKTGDYQVLIRLKAPFPAAVEYLAGPIFIYPGRYYTEVGPRGMSANPVGTGPYKVVEHQSGRLVRFERNTEYFAASPKAKPTIGKIEMRMIPDANTQVAELLAGGLDWIFNVQPDQAADLRRRGFEVTAGDTMRASFLSFNTTESAPTAALRDIRVRRAIIHAIDRQTILNTLVGAGGRVLHTICFPTQFGCTDEGVTRYAYDPARARALLTEAGFPNGLDIDLYAYRDRPHMEAVIGYLRAVGIRANLNYVQAVAVRDAMRSGKAPITQVTWGSFSINDASAFTSFFYKFAEDDVTRDPQIRDWLQRADTSTNSEQRKAAFKSALTRIADQAYAAPLFSLPVNYAHAKELSFTPYPDQLPRFWESSWK